MTQGNLPKQREYLEFILSADSKQAKLLIKTTTRSQLKFIQEVFYNIVNRKITFPEKQTKSLLRYRSIIKKVSDKGSLSQKLELVRSKPSVVLKILK